MTEIWKYDLKTQIWTLFPSKGFWNLLPSNGLNLVTNSQILHVPASDASSSTKIYLYGGIIKMGTNAYVLSVLYVYDLISLSWSRLRYIKQKAKKLV
jgi:hypothetical protein